jgi:HK97 family phage portal protein
VTLLAGLFERRSIENPAVPLTSQTLVDFLDPGSNNDSGVAVNETTALAMPAVWRAVNLIAGTAATLPLKTYRNGTKERAVVRLLENPHPDMPPNELWELSYAHRLLWGNSYFRKVRNAAGNLVWLLPIDPGAVKVGRTKRDPDMMSGKVYEVAAEGGQKVAWTDYEVLHIPGFGYDGVCGVSPIRLARQSIGLALAAEKTGAKLFGSGNMMSGILQTEQRLDNEQADRIKSRWRQSVQGLANSHDIAVIGSGAKFQPVTMPNSDAQFLESRRFQVSEIARWFGIPPHMLFDVEKTTSWGTGIEQQSIGFVVFTLRQWLVRTEQRVTREATPPGVYAEYAVEGLLRGDSAARAAFYKTMREIGAFNVDQVLALENLPPLPDGQGQGHIQPLNFGPLTDDEETPDAQDPNAA